MSITQSLELKKFSLTHDYTIMIKSVNDFIIGGYASVIIKDEGGNEVPDLQGDVVDLEALKEGFARMMKEPSRRNLNASHTNLQIGEILLEHVDSGGLEWKSMVVEEPNEQYPKIGLFTVARLFDDTEMAKRYREMMRKNKMLSFSIGGEILHRKTVCNDSNCYNKITRIDLSEISSCEKGANQESNAIILKQIITLGVLDEAKDGASLLKLLADSKYRRMP